MGTWLVLIVWLVPAAGLWAGDPEDPSGSPCAGKYLALTIRGRNYPVPFQDVDIRYLAEKCYIVGKVVPSILSKDRRAAGRVWFPLSDAAEIVEFDTLAKLREFYNHAP